LLKVELEKAKEEFRIEKENVPHSEEIKVDANKYNNGVSPSDIKDSTAIQNSYDLKRTNNPMAQNWNKKSTKAISNKEWAEAIRTASIAISLDPGLSLPYINRAWAYCEKKFYHKAIKDCNVAIFLNTDEAAPYITKAWAYAEIKNYEAAIENCNKALEVDPKNATAYNNIGYVYHKKGNMKEAKKNYEKACRFGFQLGCNNYKAIAGYSPSDIPSRVQDLIKQSQTKFKEKKWDEIITLVTEVIEIDPNNHIAYTILGAVYANKGSYNDAIKNCEIAIGLNPDFGLAYNNRGYAYELLGKKKEAELDYEMSCYLGEQFGCINMKKLKKALNTQ
jgi:tetratricopeptide (TPR) repeat protein